MDRDRITPHLHMDSHILLVTGVSSKNRCKSSESGSSSVEEDEPSSEQRASSSRNWGGLAFFHAARGNHWPVISTNLPHP